jgi:hypothetical protein
VFVRFWHAAHNFQEKVLRKYNHRFDAEGAGEMFKVTALPFDNQEKENGEIDYKEDFFEKKPT